MKNKIALILALFLFSLILSSIFLLDANSPYGNDKKSQWNYVTDSPTTGGFGECVVGDGDYIYILRQWRTGSSASFNRYDPEKDIWTDLSGNLPAEDFKNGVAMAYDYQGNFYVLTGSAYDDGAERVIFYRYNISQDAWSMLSNTPHVQGAGDAVVYSDYDGRIYAFLGRAEYTGDYNPDTPGLFARYDPTINTWENLSYPSWMGTDDGCSLAWSGGRYLYALQGEYLENFPLRNFARYDIETDKWENMSNIPAVDGVGDGGSLLWVGYYDSSLSDLIFALDGNGCNETPGYNFTVYHISIDSWEKLDDLPSPVGYYVGNRLAYHNGKIYYWQGTPGTWSGGGKEMYSYDMSTISESGEWFSLSLIFLSVFIVALKKR